MIKHINRRVGVIGFLCSGKTVLLTSLINHLMDHDPQRCNIGRTRGTAHRIVGFRRLPPHHGLDEFEYETHRRRLVDGHAWPVKTRAVSEYRCAFKHMVGRDADRERRVTLSLLDLPGERLADLPMADMSYADWSEHTLAMFAGQFPTHAAPYTEHIASDAATEPSVTAAYRELLARLTLAYAPVATPSTFLVAPDGGYPPSADHSVERLVATRCAGLAENRQFAPLSAVARERMPGVVSMFEERYRTYRRKIVRPLTNWLSRCDTLVVLVDIPTILSAGVDMYNGNAQLLRQLVHSAAPARTRPARWLRRALNLATLWRHSIPAVGKLAFVATKADLVVQEDRINLQHLLREMTGRMGDAAPGLRRDWSAIAAVDSTKDVGANELECYLRSDGPRTPDAAPAVVAPTRIPTHWPHDFAPGQYTFPDVWPDMPARRDAAPRHINLHHLLGFIL